MGGGERAGILALVPLDRRPAPVVVTFWAALARSWRWSGTSVGSAGRAGAGNRMFLPELPGAKDDRRCRDGDDAGSGTRFSQTSTRAGGEREWSDVDDRSARED